MPRWVVEVGEAALVLRQNEIRVRQAGVPTQAFVEFDNIVVSIRLCDVDALRPLRGIASHPLSRSDREFCDEAGTQRKFIGVYPASRSGGHAIQAGSDCLVFRLRSTQQVVMPGLREIAVDLGTHDAVRMAITARAFARYLVGRVPGK